MAKAKQTATCPGCSKTRVMFRRGLCGACYKDTAIRKQHAPLRTSDDISGRRFGRLSVTRQAGVGKFGKRLWLCLCDCGKQTTIATGALTTGNTTSCGCWKLEVTGDAHRTHGQSRTAEYRIWCLMRSRCGDETNEDYPGYGGRGIKVCSEWQGSYERFIADVGKRPRPGMSINRIDNDGNYEPGNVCWSTQKEQCRNKRSNHMLTHNGETMCLSAWAERGGIDQRLLWKRIKRGWSLARALTP